MRVITSHTIEGGEYVRHRVAVHGRSLLQCDRTRREVSDWLPFASRPVCVCVCVCVFVYVDIRHRSLLYVNTECVLFLSNHRMRSLAM